LALNGEEGRGKLRKAAGTGKHGSIRRCPNGATRVVEDYSFRKESTRGELKHLSTRRNRKQTVIPLVVASERGRAQTGFVTASPGL
jgi:hypothetical protein